MLENVDTKIIIGKEIEIFGEDHLSLVSSSLLLSEKESTPMDIATKGEHKIRVNYNL
jgi:hypothetical protein